MVFTVLIVLAELASAGTRDFVTAGRTDAGAFEAQGVQPEASPSSTPIGQLTNPRTGVTCTMRILSAAPADPESVRPAPSQVDPGIRGHVSPCLD
jgi:hypothetical protein